MPRPYLNLTYKGVGPGPRKMEECLGAEFGNGCCVGFVHTIDQAWVKLMKHSPTKVYELMRSWDGQAEILFAQSTEKVGTLAVGPATAEYAIKASVIEGYLRYLRKGLNPVAAATKARFESDTFIAEHNSKRPCMHWRLVTNDAFIDGIASSFVNLLEGSLNFPPKPHRSNQ